MNSSAQTNIPLPMPKMVAFFEAFHATDPAALEQYTRGKTLDVNKPFGCDKTLCSLSGGHEEHQYTVLSCVLTSFVDGHIGIEECVKMLQFLLEQGVDTEAESMVSHTDVEVTAMRYLFTTLALRPNRQRVQDLVRIIGLLIHNGTSMFTKSYTARQAPQKILDVGLNLHTAVVSPVAVPMMLHCPPTLLELVLKAFKRQGFALIAPGINQRDLDVIHTYLDQLVRKIHAFLFRPSGEWKESFPGEIAKMLEKKIRLLSKYDAVLECDKKVLENLLVVVGEVQRIGQEEGGWHLFRNGKRCWDKLVSPVIVIQNSAKYRNERAKELYARGSQKVIQHGFFASDTDWWRFKLCPACQEEYPGLLKWNTDMEWRDSLSWYKFWDRSDKSNLQRIKDEWTMTQDLSCMMCKKNEKGSFCTFTVGEEKSVTVSTLETMGKGMGMEGKELACFIEESMAQLTELNVIGEKWDAYR
ncbi:hypothetical protein G7046_g2536 [Stylonectria norvegica]|nr:hypothetical protein G7046_g2536 [Stylonectria norvegica]